MDRAGRPRSEADEQHRAQRGRHASSDLVEASRDKRGRAPPSRRSHERETSALRGRHRPQSASTRTGTRVRNAVATSTLFTACSLALEGSSPLLTPADSKVAISFITAAAALRQLHGERGARSFAEPHLEFEQRFLPQIEPSCTV